MEPLLTEEMILRKYASIPEFAKAAGMAPQSIYNILDNPRWGRTRKSERTWVMLKELLDA